MTLNFKQTCRAVVCACTLLCSDILVAENRPWVNVVVILADDLGYGDVGVYGAEAIRTPRIDQMAAQGVLLTNAYASASNCTPSRAGLLTGRYAIRSGLAHQVIFVENTNGLPLEEVTIAEMLKQQSYQTALIGKWHLGHTAEFWPTQQGFDYFYGLPFSNNQKPLALYRGSQQIEEPVVQSTLTERYTSEAIAFMEEHRNQPFFIYLSHTAVHVPLSVSKRFEGQSQAGLYGDMVETLDWSTGEILDTLARLNLDDNTLVILTSDNGPYQGGSSGGLRGTKGTPWDGGYRVPFIARWPKRIPAGTSRSGISMNIDILPTVQAVTNANLPADLLLDGKNIMPMLIAATPSPHDKLYIFADERIAAVRTQQWKAVFLARYRGINRWLPDHDVRLLFDMDRDPYERYSLAAHNELMWNTMMSYLAEGNSEFLPLALHLDPE